MLQSENAKESSIWFIRTITDSKQAMAIHCSRLHNSRGAIYEDGSLLAMYKANSGMEIAEIVMHEVCRHHGLPDSIIRYRGPQFVSKFWKHLFKMLKVTCNLSSCYHPQTNGQAERTNQTLEQYSVLSKLSTG